MVANEERAHWLDRARTVGHFAIALALLEVAEAINKLATSRGNPGLTNEATVGTVVGVAPYRHIRSGPPDDDTPNTAVRG